VATAEGGGVSLRSSAVCTLRLQAVAGESAGVSAPRASAQGHPTPLRLAGRPTESDHWPLSPGRVRPARWGAPSLARPPVASGRTRRA